MKTLLYDRHVTLGAKMGQFCGWNMPIYYQGIIAEHLGVRREAGVFDVSHMGRIEITGSRASDFMEYVSTNGIIERPNYSATYTVLATEKGGCIDDTIVYRVSQDRFFTIANACNRVKDFEHFRRLAKRFDVTVRARYEEEGIISIQGPKAEAILTKVLDTPVPQKAMTFMLSYFKGQQLILSRTGYTGSTGFELFAVKDLIVPLWDALLSEGEDHGLMPAGLGARDTLRLEAGFALYGHELSDTIAPTESVSAWTVKWKKEDFLGKEALVKLEASPKKRSQHGVALLDRGVARQGYPVFHQGRCVGAVTSGTVSPCLNRSIAIVMVNGSLAYGEKIEIEVRGKRLKGEVVKLPFYRQ